MKKILFFTGSRADYGLIKDLLLKMQEHAEYDVHLAVSGSHVSEKFGKSINQIMEDGIKNIHLIQMTIINDRPENIIKAMSEEMLNFSAFFSKNKFDLVILLGDRYEIWPPAIVANINNVPIAHIHGGESTEGLIDEAVRHSVTKMSHLHFCSHQRYRNRIISMGENPNRVFYVGAMGVARVLQNKFLSKDELEKKLNFKFNVKNILCVFHPVTLNEVESSSEIKALVSALEVFLSRNLNINLFISLPNADQFSDAIRGTWDVFQGVLPRRIHCFEHLGDHGFLSLLNNCDVMIGNSSSGILEAPYLNKAIINIGRRQEGRACSEHILQSSANFDDLLICLEKAFSSDFQNQCKSFEKIYGDGDAVSKIINVLSDLDWDSLINKKFYEVFK